MNRTGVLWMIVYFHYVVVNVNEYRGLTALLFWWLRANISGGLTPVYFTCTP